ncbi:hypothetical protein [Pseudomonas sp. CBC3]|uniref:hypothetical protein n=1 Tax=Pseudomonas sp. CBC3 TaxID=3123318 RepID=UPI0030E91889
MGILNSNSIDAARYLFISKYMPLRMFEANCWSADLQKPRSHPAPPVRMMYLIYIFSSEVLSGEIFNIPSGLAKDYVLGWALECEESYMRLQGDEIDPRGLASVWEGPETTDYIESIQREYARMESALDAFAFNSSY